MLRIPENLNSSFAAFLSKENVPINSVSYHKKWLRYYLDYCYKYHLNERKRNDEKDGKCAIVRQIR